MTAAEDDDDDSDGFDSDGFDAEADADHDAYHDAYYEPGAEPPPDAPRERAAIVETPVTEVVDIGAPVEAASDDEQDLQQDSEERIR
jgi:hypothetical protein